MRTTCTHPKASESGVWIVKSDAIGSRTHKRRRAATGQLLLSLTAASEGASLNANLLTCRQAGRCRRAAADSAAATGGTRRRLGAGHSSLSTSHLRPNCSIGLPDEQETTWRWLIQSAAQARPARRRLDLSGTLAQGVMADCQIGG